MAETESSRSRSELSLSPTTEVRGSRTSLQIPDWLRLGNECSAHTQKIGSNQGCLPFTRNNWLVESCSKWYASNPKGNFQWDAACSISTTFSRKIGGAFHSAKNSEISGPKLNRTVKIPGNFKVFENLGILLSTPSFPENRNNRRIPFHSTIPARA